MRSLWFLPLAYVAGIHGFAMFAPYLAVVFGALHLRTRLRARAARLAAGAAEARARGESLPPSSAAEAGDVSVPVGMTLAVG